jgi:hypothetical protein
VEELWTWEDRRIRQRLDEMKEEETNLSKIKDLKLNKSFEEEKTIFRLRTKYIIIVTLEYFRSVAKPVVCTDIIRFRLNF